jgi:hypothetical protein
MTDEKRNKLIQIGYRFYFSTEA